ncbi:MAG: pitrilysin family protein [Elusimicrobiota bacterium]|jgi:zinc protease
MRKIPAALLSMILAGWAPVQAAAQAVSVVPQNGGAVLPAVNIPALQTGTILPLGTTLALPKPGLPSANLQVPADAALPIEDNQAELGAGSVQKHEGAAPGDLVVVEDPAAGANVLGGQEQDAELNANENGDISMRQTARQSARGLLERTVSAILHPEAQSPSSALNTTFDASGKERRSVSEEPLPVSVPKLDLKTSTFVLDNGLTLVVQPDASVPVAAVSITYKVGSMDERAGEFGWAHAAEHLMFDGSEAYPGKSFDRVTEAFGGGNNARTNSLDTTYHEIFTADGLEKVLSLEAERMRRLALRPDLFANEIQVVLQEWRQNFTDKPYVPALNQRLAAAFSDPGKAHPIIGLEEDIRSATPESMRAFIARHYAPNNAVIAITGAVTPEEALRLVRKTFGSLPRRSLPERNPGREPALQGTREFTVSDHLAQTPISIVSWHMPPRGSKDFWALTLLAQLFSQGDASPLYQALGKSAKLILGLECRTPDHNETRGTELFDLITFLMPGIPGSRVTAAIDEVLRRFAEQGPSRQELELAKTMTEFDWIGGMESMEERVEFLSTYASMVGDPSRLSEDLSGLLSVTAQDVARAVKTWLLDRGRVVVHDMPVPAPEALTQESAQQSEPGAIVAEGLSREELLKDAPALPPVELPQASSMVLSNGLKVVVVRDARLPLVQARLSIPRRNASGPQGEPGLREALADLLFSGTREKTAQQLAQEFSGLGYEVSAANDQDATRLQAAGLSRNLEAFLQELLGPLSAAAYPDDEVALWLDQEAEALHLRDSKPDKLASNRLMAEVFKGHPYGRVLENADLAAVTPEGLRKFHSETWSPEGATLLLYGDVDPSSAKALLEKSLGRWQGKGGKAPLPATPLSSAAKTVLVDRPGSKQATLVMGMAVPLTISDEDYVPFLVLNEVFGGSMESRLFQNLREAHGYTYGVYSGARRLKDCLLWSIRGGVRGDALRDSLAEIRKEFDRIRTERVGELELAAAKRRIVGTYLMNLASLSNKAGQMQLYIEAGQDPAQALKARIQRIESLTADELLAVARKYLDPKNLSTVVVGDQAALSPQLAEIRSDEPAQ